MTLEDISRQIQALTADPVQRNNALALLSVLGGMLPDDISRNPYTHAISLDWEANGEWDNVLIDIFSHGFESTLSSNKELRIKHWPSDLQPEALNKLVSELLVAVT